MSSQNECQNCQKTFKTKAGLVSHEKYCKKEIFQCQYCKSKFKTKANMTKHLKSCPFKDIISEYSCKLKETEEKFNKLLELKEFDFKKRENELLEKLKEKDNDNKSLKCQIELLLKNPRIVNNNNNKTTNVLNDNKFYMIDDDLIKSFGVTLFENVLSNLDSFARVCANGLKDHVKVTDTSRHVIEYVIDNQKIKDKGGYKLSSEIFNAAQPEAEKLMFISNPNEPSHLLAKQVKNKAPSVINEFGKSLVTYCDRFKSIKKTLKNIENFKAAIKERFETFGVDAFHYEHPANVIGYIVQEFNHFLGEVENGKFNEVLSDNNRTYVKLTGHNLCEVIKDVLISEEHALKFHVANLKSSNKYEEVKGLINRFLNFESDEELINIVHNQWILN